LTFITVPDQISATSRICGFFRSMPDEVHHVLGVVDLLLGLLFVGDCGGGGVLGPRGLLLDRLGLRTLDPEREDRVPDADLIALLDRGVVDGLAVQERRVLAHEVQQHQAAVLLDANCGLKVGQPGVFDLELGRGALADRDLGLLVFLRAGVLSPDRNREGEGQRLLLVSHGIGPWNLGARGFVAPTSRGWIRKRPRLMGARPACGHPGNGSFRWSAVVAGRAPPGGGRNPTGSG
jgi:hypothetical protein